MKKNGKNKKKKKGFNMKKEKGNIISNKIL